MKNPYFEEPQAGNPHNLTIWQHIVPKKSLARFSNTRGEIEVFRIKQYDILKLRAKNKFFCAKRIWNQKEEVTSIKIENAFQKVAEALINDQVHSLSQDMQRAVTEMYLLWRVRYIYTANPLPDQSFAPFISGSKLSKDDQEHLEKLGCGYIRQDGTMPSRAVTSILFRRDIDIAIADGANTITWGIIKSPEGLEFICPDSTINQPLLPISPNICLVGGWLDGVATPFAIGHINRALMYESKYYWLARDLAKCPTLKRVNLYSQGPERVG